jgi:hypothetical protein
MHTRIVFGTALTGVALAGSITLMGCSSIAKPTATATKLAATTTLACKEQYLAWRSGPARNPLNQFTAAQNNLAAVGSTKNLQEITAAVENEGQAASKLAAYPVPACADPHGYFAALLAQVRAAASNAATANGLSALVQAIEPLNQVPALESDFTTEIKQTTGI